MLIGISGKIGSGKDTVGQIIQALTGDKSDWLTIERVLEIYNQTGNFPATDVFTSTWKIKKFAGKLKQMVSLLTGIPVEDLEKQEVKDRVLGSEWVKEYETYNRLSVLTETVNKSFTVRQLLQELGTNAIRNVIHPNAWVNALFADYKDLGQQSDGFIHEKYGDIDIKIEPNPILWKEYYPNWVITDVRFPNEAEAIKARGGILIKLIRWTKGEPPKDGKYYDVFTNDAGLLLQYDKVTFVEGYCTYDGEIVPNITDYRLHDSHPSETALDGSPLFDYIINNSYSIEELIEEVKGILIDKKIINEN